MGRKHSLTVPGRYDRIDQICEFIVSGASQAGLSAQAAFQVRLACDEACTNIIEHAYGGEDRGNIQASWEVEAGTLTITLRDTGRPFAPEQVPPPELPAGGALPGKLRVGGLGLHIIRQLMDDIQFSFDEGGNRLVLVKRRASPGQENRPPA